MNESDYQLRQLVERYMAAYFVLFKKLNVQIGEVIQDDATLDQYQIIDYIATHENGTSTELAEAFSVGKSSITAIITRLVDKGIVERTRDVQDRRVVYLSLTEHGRMIYSKMQGSIMDMLSAYVAHFSAEEIDGFIRPFEKLAKLVEEGKPTI
ncbi:MULTISPECIES: MarR family winged helix-turn-helix transcriptional regulator [unclassified Paenibacillus]|uniref:MarR family winged helix-turn-helix transcriptional regulator n=1 Tax=unclassified Paenibacillus TaxID=185978 RepID=UPI000837C3B4|nr:MULTISPECIES: MarR family transcriptional regulator [unclassified Paenibacillus]NWL88981.1 MarR family transcriptional regulator [Paenibacillus sp. 79R4]